MFEKLKRSIRKRLFTVTKPFGVTKYAPKTALNEIDTKLEKYINYERGFFIEAGGNDGKSQSNTFYLEFGKHWRGLLVEAIPELYKKCKKLRTRSHVYNRALVSPEHTEPTMRFHFANLMSIGENAMPPEQLKQHIKEGMECQNISQSYVIEVPTATLESILDEIHAPTIDLLSLDLEGAEISALRGLNLNKYRPKYILMEVRDLEETDRYLTANNYTRIEKLSHHDYLYTDSKTRA